MARKVQKDSLDPDNKVANEEQAVYGPGEVLRQAREALNYGQDDVARRLHLPMSVVEALEENRFSELPEATYIRGYIRSYARFLEIDADALVKRFNAYSQADEPSLPPHRSAESRRTHNSGIWGALSILLILGALVGVWWLSEHPEILELVRFSPTEPDEAQLDASAAIEEPVVQRESFELLEAPGEPPERFRTGDQATSISAMPGAPGESTVPDEIALPREDIVAPQQEDIVTPQQEDVVAPQQQDTIAPQPQENTEVVAPLEDDAQRADEENETESRVTEQAAQELVAAPLEAVPVAEPEVQAQVQAETDQLILAFSDQSWTEVYDANNARLLFDLVKSGSVRTLEGTAPFKVLLGNATAVQISINGQPFDHRPFSRGDNTARFTVALPSRD